MEHRWGNRVAVDLPVRLYATGLSGSGILKNLSASGAYIETALPIAPLTTLRVEIPGGLDPRAKGSDAWGFAVRQDIQGVGVAWCDFAPLHAEDLQAARHSRAPASSINLAQQ
jgi:hypothetical protein